VASIPKAAAFAERSSVASARTLIVGDESTEPSAPSVSCPASTVVLPVWVLAAPSESVPSPDFVRASAPMALPPRLSEITPLWVAVLFSATSMMALPAAVGLPA